MRGGLAFLLGLLALLMPASAPAAQQGGIAAGEIFRQFLAAHFAGHRDDAPDATYRVAWYDLNDDGRLEAIVYMNAPIWCGPHGCDLFIFTPDGQSWRQLAELSAGTPPIRVLDRRRNGWREISLYVRTSLMPGRQEPFFFDGRNYQSNDVSRRARPLRRPDEGRLLIPFEGEGRPLFRASPSRPR